MLMVAELVVEFMMDIMLVFDVGILSVREFS